MNGNMEHETKSSDLTTCDNLILLPRTKISVVAKKYFKNKGEQIENGALGNSFKAR